MTPKLKAHADDLLIVLDAIHVAGGYCPAATVIRACIKRWGLLGSDFFVDLIEAGIVEICPEQHAHLTNFGQEMRQWIASGANDNAKGNA